MKNHYEMPPEDIPYDDFNDATDTIDSSVFLTDYDLFIEKGDITYKADDGKTKISLTKAAKHFMEKYKLLASMEGSSKAGNKLWIYNTKKGLYTPNGCCVIKYFMEEICGDLCRSHIENEVINRICTHRPFDPEKFDPDPYLLCVRNGVIDLRSGKFVKHSSDYLMTMGIDKRYDPKATFPNLLKFFEDIVEDPKDIDTVLDFLAVCLIQKPYDIFLELIGTGANGKGRLLLFVRWFLGRDNVTSTPLRQLGGRFADNSLYGKWVLINGESEGKFPIEVIKDLISGNPRTVEIKNGGFVGYVPFLKILVDTNNPAVIEDRSKGRQRRHYTLNFKKEFVHNPNPNNKRQILRDDHILDKLCTDKEASGLLNELIRRAGELIKGRPIYRRKSEEQTMEEYDAQTHSVSGFIDNWCEIDDKVVNSMTYDKSKMTSNKSDIPYTSAGDLYAAYKSYCGTLNITPKSQRSLGRYLTSLGLKSKHVGDKRVRSYYGLTLLPLVDAVMNTKAGGEKAAACTLEQIENAI